MVLVPIRDHPLCCNRNVATSPPSASISITSIRALVASFLNLIDVLTGVTFLFLFSTISVRFFGGCCLRHICNTV